MRIFHNPDLMAILGIEQDNSSKLDGAKAGAQSPFRSLKRIFDHSKVRFTANLKLALWAQTLGLRPFRFTKNG